jgi:2-haloacid dehalogenase
MTDADFNDITACVFDAYGTLFDVHSAVARGGEKLGEKAAPISALWRQKQLEYAWLSDIMGAHLDLWQTTTRALDFAMATFGIDDPTLRDDLLDLYMSLTAYPEVASTLDTLRENSVGTAILSNGSPKMVRAAVESARLAAAFDAVLSVEEVGIHKPAAPAYQLAVDRLAVEPARTCFISSNGWDIAGAARFGFKALWCNRFGLQQDLLPAGPHAVVASLDELPALIRLGR